MGARNRTRSATSGKIVALAGGLAMLGALAGCGSDAASSAAPADPTLLYPDTLTVCTSLSYNPFEFTRNGVHVGLDVELAQQVADELEARLDLVDVRLDDIVSGAALNVGTCDMAIRALTVTGDRARVLDFSSTYASTNQALVGSKAAAANGSTDFAGRRIAVEGDTMGEVFVQSRLPADAELIELDSVTEIRQALAGGRADLAVVDAAAVGTITKRSGAQEMTSYAERQDLAVAVKKDGNPDLLRVVNAVIAELREDGTLATMQEQWLGTTS